MVIFSHDSCPSWTLPPDPASSTNIVHPEVQDNYPQHVNCTRHPKPLLSEAAKRQKAREAAQSSHEPLLSSGLDQRRATFNNHHQERINLSRTHHVGHPFRTTCTVSNGCLSCFETVFRASAPGTHPQWISILRVQAAYCQCSDFNVSERFCWSPCATCSKFKLEDCCLCEIRSLPAAMKLYFARSAARRGYVAHIFRPSAWMK